MIDDILRNNIINSLNHQGFLVNGHVEPMEFNKETFRSIHQFSKDEQLGLQKKFIKSAFPVISKYLRNGSDINPAEIKLELREIIPGSLEHTIYRWWNLIWWSIPYQRAYGRQMRFLLWDKTHDSPFGILGLQSPVLKMAVRDNHLKIPLKDLDYWVNKSMQAQRVGALPPYNSLLGGKMTAMALASDEVRHLYGVKYQNVETRLEKRIIDSDLLFITTTSAFGRSSIYNRLKFDNTFVAKSIGFTKGSGTFHINESIYGQIKEYLKSKGVNTNTTFGNGPSRKIKLLDTAFSLLKLPDYQYHNIQREYFLFPLASNLDNVIHESAKPIFASRPLDGLVDFWKERWCKPRAARCPDWKEFSANNFLDKYREFDNE